MDNSFIIGILVVIYVIGNIAKVFSSGKKGEKARNAHGQANKGAPIFQQMQGMPRGMNANAGWSLEGAGFGETRKRVATAAPQAAAAQSSTQQHTENFFIEAPEQEGKSVTDHTADPLYNSTIDAVPNHSAEWRKAIIAHEILKRKF